ncbi:MAG: hypothetical protein JWP75_1645 [Frondihabitans sp.]|nr:hypothetical protein [Frondihabitans sp.]
MTSSDPDQSAARPARLRADDVSLGYDRRTVSTALSAEILEGSFTVIIGPNACGKSTLLKAFARLLRPSAGRILLDGRDLAEFRPKEAARLVGLLPQSATAPDGITVEELVQRGRYPHQGLVRRWARADQDAVVTALVKTDLTSLAGVPVAELSGGQRQRAWVAMALAQETSVLLLDEPTTFLDIAHQVDLLDLFADLHERGTTIVAVLHDLNQAARYATNLIVVKEGRVVATGAPSEVITEDLITDVFGLECRVIEDPETGGALVVPRDRRRSGRPAG